MFGKGWHNGVNLYPSLLFPGGAKPFHIRGSVMLYKAVQLFAAHFNTLVEGLYINCGNFRFKIESKLPDLLSGEPAVYIVIAVFFKWRFKATAQSQREPDGFIPAYLTPHMQFGPAELHVIRIREAFPRQLAQPAYKHARLAGIQCRLLLLSAPLTRLHSYPYGQVFTHGHARDFDFNGFVFSFYVHTTA